MPCDTPSARVDALIHPPARRIAARIMADLAVMSAGAHLDGAHDDCREALEAIADETAALLDLASLEGK